MQSEQHLLLCAAYRALRCTHFRDRNLHAEIGVWIAEKCLQSCSCMCHTVQLELPHMITQMVTSISAYVIKWTGVSVRMSSTRGDD